MATTYKSDLITQGTAVTAPMTGNVAAQTATFTQTAAFVINDIVQMVSVPNGYQVTDIILDTDQLDTNVSPTITLDVGDSGAAQAYVAADTVGQAGGVIHAKVAGFTSHTPVAIATSGGNAGSTIIQVKVHAAPATGTTTAVLRMTVYYFQKSTVAGAAFA